MNEVDAIILDLDGGQRLDACLASMAAQTVRPARVIIVDNGSRVPTASRLAASPELSVQIIRHEVNLGFAGGVNAAFPHIAAPLVGLVNNDAVLERDWLAALLPLFDEPAVAAAQTVICRDEETIDGAGIDISDGTYRQAGHGAPLRGFVPRQPWGVSATAAVFRTAALRQVAVDGDLFDRRFFAYYEDVELNARLLAAGWKVRLLDEPKARHSGSATEEALGGHALRLRVRNRYFVNRLHPEVGRRTALLAEDARRAGRALLRARLGETLVIGRAVVEGTLGSLPGRFV